MAAIASVFRVLAGPVAAAVLAVLAVLAAHAHADMKAFNAAATSGDYKTAAAEAKAIWPTFDKTKDSTAVVAREFGFTNYVAGDYAAARDFGQYLKDNAADLPKPDEQPEVTTVLLAAANFGLKSGEATRKALVESLQAREAADGIDNVTILAAERLYRSDLSRGAWSRASESAAIAGRLVGRGGIPVAHRALEARALAAATGFISSPNKRDYDRLVDTHDAAIDAIDAATDPRRRQALVLTKYQLEAWATSVESYFHAAQQTGSNIPQRIKPRTLKKAKAPFFDARVAANSCRGEIDGKGVVYPPGAAYRGIVGTIIMKHDFDGEGRILKSEVLGAAPAYYFAEAIQKSESKIRLKRGSEDPSACDLAQTNRVITYQFHID